MRKLDQRELLEVETIHGGRADGHRFFLDVVAEPEGVLRVLEQRFGSRGVGRVQALRAAERRQGSTSKEAT